MSVKNHYIRRYQYEFLGSNKEQPDKPVAALYLYGDKRNLLACLFFTGGDITSLPVENDGVVIARYSINEFSMIIDMLRNEKPIIFCWNDASQTIRLTTGSEPVGEEELKRLFSFLYI